ncbi:hypothetical protein Q8A67_022521 [Cirrhinus molitorella]|uniref:Uncharacterized protein n=1 Tax=Cirrhinus molitorella TaxID=172907 RepID=A0AA88P9Q0_9TELE|nr:hypothetical protein Q8A67_022521 [Cirrhinus molitorella]
MSLMVIAQAETPSGGLKPGRRRQRHSLSGKLCVIEKPANEIRSWIVPPLSVSPSVPPHSTRFTSISEAFSQPQLFPQKNGIVKRERPLM